MRAKVVGARVWNFVSEILTNPSNLARGLERMIENERAPSTAEDEALWLKQIAALDLKHERLLDLRLDGDITPEQFRARSTELKDVRVAAQDQLEASRSPVSPQRPRTQQRYPRLTLRLTRFPGTGRTPPGG
jgi:hypothetical protein